MTIYGTMNPIGSTELPDLRDNAQNLDLFSLGMARYYQDRLGQQRISLHGIEDQALEAINLIGYVYTTPLVYTAGITLTIPNQIFLKDGEYYKSGPSVSLPYTTTGDWATEQGLFRSIGDARLRSELASSLPDKGASLIFGNARTFATRALAKASSYVPGSTQMLVADYQDGYEGGGGIFVYRASDTTSADNGAEVLVKSDGSRWHLRTANGAFDARQAGVVANNVVDDTAALQRAIDATARLKSKLALPGGDILITATLKVPQNDFCMEGAGYHTNLRHKFNGPLFQSLATSGGSTYHHYSKFRIVSESVKTVGAYCFDFDKGLIRTTFKDIELIGNGAANTAYGFITADIYSTFDTITWDNVVLNQINGRGYNIPKGSGLWFFGGRVIGDSALTSGATGIYLNGGMGGVWVFGTDLIQCDTGFWATQDNGVSNRELFFPHACADSCARFGYRFSDSSYVSVAGLWASSCGQANVQFDDTYNGDANIVGGTAFNAGSYGGPGAKDGIVINGGNNIVIDGVSVRDNDGYGIRCTKTDKPASLVLDGCNLADNGRNQIGGANVRWSGGSVVGTPIANLSIIAVPGKCRITNVSGVNDAVAVITPAMPASSATYTYQGFVPVMVYISGGSVTSVRINGVLIFASSNISIQVTAGDTVSMEYTVAPTWTFVRSDG